MASESERYEALYVIVDEIWDLFFSTLQIHFDNRHTPDMPFLAWNTLQTRNRFSIQAKLNRHDYNRAGWFIQRLDAWRHGILGNIITIFANGLSYGYKIADLESYRNELRGEIKKRVASSKTTK